MEHRPDLDAAERAFSDLLSAIGRNTADPELAGTPRRAATALAELVTSPGEPAVTLMPSEGYTGLLLMRDIPFQSLCEHHLLPFRGVAHVGYLPGASIVGISTLARAVDHFAHGLQMQERLTNQVVSWMDAQLAPRGSGVVIEAEHLCMSFRGVGTPDTHVVTSQFSGELVGDLGSRAQFGACDDAPDGVVHAVVNGVVDGGAA